MSPRPDVPKQIGVTIRSVRPKRTLFMISSRHYLTARERRRFDHRRLEMKPQKRPKEPVSENRTALTAHCGAIGGKRYFLRFRVFNRVMALEVPQKIVQTSSVTPCIPTRKDQSCPNDKRHD